MSLFTGGAHSAASCSPPSSAAPVTAARTATQRAPFGLPDFSSNHRRIMTEGTTEEGTTEEGTSFESGRSGIEVVVADAPITMALDGEVADELARRAASRCGERPENREVRNDTIRARTAMPDMAGRTRQQPREVAARTSKRCLVALATARLAGLHRSSSYFVTSTYRERLPGFLVLTPPPSSARHW